MKKIYSFMMMALVAMAVLSSCGSSERAFTPQEQLLMSKLWMADLNADIKAGTDMLKDSTGVSADGLQLGGDVAKIGNFLASKYNFGTGQDDPSQLVYAVTSGEGIFKTTTEAGLWKMSDDGKTLEMASWDYDKGCYSDVWVKAQIIELTDSKLVWKKDGDATNSYFVPAN